MPTLLGNNVDNDNNSSNNVNTSNLSQGATCSAGHLKLSCTRRRLLSVSGESGAHFVEADNELRCDDVNDDNEVDFVVDDGDGR